MNGVKALSSVTVNICTCLMNFKVSLMLGFGACRLGACACPGLFALYYVCSILLPLPTISVLYCRAEFSDHVCSTLTRSSEHVCSILPNFHLLLLYQLWLLYITLFSTSCCFVLRFPLGRATNLEHRAEITECDVIKWESRVYTYKFSYHVCSKLSSF